MGEFSEITQNQDYIKALKDKQVTITYLERSRIILDFNIIQND